MQACEVTSTVDPCVSGSQWLSLFWDYPISGFIREAGVVDFVYGTVFFLLLGALVVGHLSFGYRIWFGFVVIALAIKTNAIETIRSELFGPSSEDVRQAARTEAASANQQLETSPLETTTLLGTFEPVSQQNYPLKVFLPWNLFVEANDHTDSIEAEPQYFGKLGFTEDTSTIESDEALAAAKSMFGGLSYEEALQQKKSEE